MKIWDSSLYVMLNLHWIMIDVEVLAMNYETRREISQNWKIANQIFRKYQVKCLELDPN